MAFNQRNRRNRIARALVGLPQRPDLALDFRRGETARAIRGIAPAADQGVDRTPGGARLLFAHEHYNAAALAGQHPGRALVVGTDIIGSQRSRLGKTDNLKRVEAYIHAARQGEVHFSIGQGVAGGSHAKQRRGTSAIYRESARAKIEVVANAARDGVGHIAGEGVLRDFRQGAFVGLAHRRHQLLELWLGHALARQSAPETPLHVGPAKAQVVTA